MLAQVTDRLIPLSIAAALSLIPSLALAAPQLVFDSWNGTNSTSNRAAGSSPGSQITIANSAKLLTNIAVRVDLNAGGNLKFVVFTHPGHQLVYVSAPKNFVDDGMTWKQSDAFSLMLAPGTYDIGAIADVGGLWQIDVAAAMMGDFSSVSTNPNFSSYAMPSSGGHAGADAAVRLYVDVAVCGDGVVDMSEECDDANMSNTDACVMGCQNAACGDGFVQAGVEDCDDANLDDTDDCTSMCSAAVCGDGFVQAGVEECDDANMADDDQCVAGCLNATCGDGFVQAGIEGCDDANMVDDDECSNACVAASCGDGVVQMVLGETCDDANMVDEDECTNACQLPACGDGIVQANEACDDANMLDEDECTNACQLPACGDGIVQANEGCDDANMDDGDACTNACQTALCGDGIVQVGVEACDDANMVDGDGCESDCSETPMGESAGDTTSEGDTTEGGDTSEGGSTEGGSTEDSGGDSGETGGADEVGLDTTDSGGGATDDGGCSCSSEADERNQGGLLGLLGLGLLAGLRRRRR